MSALSYRTAGESHGPALVVIVEGLPAGLPLDEEWIGRMLARRQAGPGRSRRQQIERDTAQVLAGRKGGRTIGSPVAILIANRDATMESLPDPPVPRPGHADLAGAQKYVTSDLRSVLERASARETAARTAAGALASLVLRDVGIDVMAHVCRIGSLAAAPRPVDDEARAIRDASPFASLDPRADEAWSKLVAECEASGDSLGGVFEVVVRGAPPGLGGYASGDQRLDGRLAAALVSIPAIKGVEIGIGFEAARLRGSEAHDAIEWTEGRPYGGFHRTTNRAGGIEGGMTNGEPVVVRAAMKPIPTLRRGLPSVGLARRRPAPATYQRSDVCSVPAASVVGEAAVAFEMARAFLDKHGGDSMEDIRAAFASWRARVADLGIDGLVQDDEPKP